ncbi:CooT family nickel-binding protein [Methanosalsum natronophilum]|uniref:CooT family nickel-binding protein n=1 Tax=Methanosalsum natronophilum TaxID=768733 RepID=UPI00216988E6|nr:CooT family nickel-binding protein [Methanosalsum natronophilum]MCS3924485.1 putative RNA-binding protein [Methanosalsum natronophilum]
MCELNVVKYYEGEKETIMESVTKITIDNNTIELTGIFGDTKKIVAKIKEVDFSKGETVIIDV